MNKPYEPVTDIESRLTVLRGKLLFLTAVAHNVENIVFPEDTFQRGMGYFLEDLSGEAGKLSNDYFHEVNQRKEEEVRP